MFFFTRRSGHPGSALVSWAGRCVKEPAHVPTLLGDDAEDRTCRSVEFHEIRGCLAVIVLLGFPERDGLRSRRRIVCFIRIRGTRGASTDRERDGRIPEVVPGRARIVSLRSDAQVLGAVRDVR